MAAAVQQSESLDLNQIQTFLAGCKAVAFTVESRAAKYALVDAVLRRHHYAEQSRSTKAMSEHELNLLRQRGLAARDSKARRGELRFALPPGYCWTELGQIEMDPDERVADAIRMVFRKFRELASDPARQAQWRAFPRRNRFTERAGGLSALVSEVAHFVLAPLHAAARREQFEAEWTPGGPWM